MVKRKQFVCPLSCLLLLIVLICFSVNASQISLAQGQEPPAAAPVLSNPQETIPPAPAPDRTGTVPPTLGGSGSSVDNLGVPPLNGSRPGALPFSGADPYATPNASGWQNPQGPYNNQYGYQQMPIYGAPPPGGIPPVGGEIGERRLIEGWEVDVLWMKGGSGARKLGLTQLDLNLTFNWVGCLKPENAFQITPGFTFNWWKMDKYSMFPFPEETYDAYLDLAWKPKLNDDWFSADLNLRMGVYSDFKEFDGHSFRLTGHAYGVITYSSKIELKLGVDYINRVKTKLLPAGGIVWKSADETWIVEALFPCPRVKKKCTFVDSQSALWFYVRGEYAGDTWTIESQRPGMTHDVVSYNDIRLALGVEFEFYHHINGYLEIGGAFDRELQYKRLHTTMSPGDSFFFEGGLRF